MLQRTLLTGIGIGRENGKPQAASNASFTAYTLEGPAKGGHTAKVGGGCTSCESS
jgi:hypothetical protein